MICDFFIIAMSIGMCKKQANPPEQFQVRRHRIENNPKSDCECEIHLRLRLAKTIRGRKFENAVSAFGSSIATQQCNVLLPPGAPLCPLLPAPLALMEARKASRLASTRRGANIFCCRMEIMSARCENLHKVNEKLKNK